MRAASEINSSLLAALTLTANVVSKVATISKDALRQIAEQKMPDLNAASVEAAMSMIAGTARSMGITVEE